MEWNKHAPKLGCLAYTSFPIFLSYPSSIFHSRSSLIFRDFQHHEATSDCTSSPSMLFHIVCQGNIEDVKYHALKPSQPTSGEYYAIYTGFQLFLTGLRLLMTGFGLPYDRENNMVTGFGLVNKRFQTFYEWIQLCNHISAIQSCTDYDADR